MARLSDYTITTKQEQNRFGYRFRYDVSGNGRRATGRTAYGATRADALKEARALRRRLAEGGGIWR